jgi:hypothetical protein
MKVVLLTLFMMQFTGLFAQWTRTSSYYTGNQIDISSSREAICVLTTEGASVLRAGDSQWHAVHPFSSLSVNAKIAGDGNLIVIDNNGYLYISCNGGLTWTEQDGPVAGLFLGLSAQTIVAINNSAEISFSSDCGETWQLTEAGGVMSGYSITYIAVMDNDLYALAAKNMAGDKLYKSAFNGTGFSSWQLVTTFNYANHSCLTSFDGILYAGSGSGVIRSGDKGVSWDELGSGGPGFIGTIVVDSANLYTDSNLLDSYSFQTGTWRPLLEMGNTFADGIGACNGHFYAFLRNYLYPEGFHEYSAGVWSRVPALFIGGESVVVSSIAAADNVWFSSESDVYGRSNYYSTNEGITWLPCNSTVQGELIDAVHSGPDYLVAGYYSFGVGIIDTATGIISQTGGLEDHSVRSFKMYHNLLYAGAEGGIYTSADQGTSWALRSLEGRIVYKLEVFSDTLFAGTDAGLFHSQDGAAWSQAGGLSSIISDIAATPENLFILSDSVIFKMDYGSNSWVPAGALPVPGGVTEIVSRDNRLYAGTSQGWIVFSDDGGSNWTDMQGTVFACITGMAFSGNKLLVSDMRSGIWKYTTGWPGSITENAPGMTLKVYPVPARDYLTLLIPTDFQGAAMVDVVASSGTVVKTISIPDARSEKIIINISGIASGTYVARLRNSMHMISSVFSKVE